MPPAVATTRQAIKSAILQTTGLASSRQALKSDFGVTLDFAETRKTVFDFSDANQQRFRWALRTSPRDVRDFFIGRLAVEDDGLIGRLRPALVLGQREMQTALSILAFLDLRGLLVNSFA